MGSILTEVAVLFVLRTRRPFYRSRPARAVVISSLLVAAITVTLPFSGLAGPLGLAPVPLSLMVVILLLTAGYVLATEAAKRIFWRVRVKGRP